MARGLAYASAETSQWAGSSARDRIAVWSKLCVSYSVRSSPSFRIRTRIAVMPPMAKSPLI